MEIRDKLRESATLNPYLYLGWMFKQIIERILWDLKPKSWKSRKKLKQLKNQYAGKKAVILCNGPSLLKTDFNSLDGIYTIGLNKINLLFDKSTFRPNCIVAINEHVIDQNYSFYNSTNIPLFLDSYGSSLVSFRENITFLHSFGKFKFSKDCSISIYPGYTVTFVALQLAFHMGFKEVTLVGCDHHFETNGPANKTVSAQKIDKNHFDPNYFSGGAKWQLPDLLQSEISYSLAKQTFEDNGRKIYNSTEGGKLEIFQRISLKSFVSINDN